MLTDEALGDALLGTLDTVEGYILYTVYFNFTGNPAIGDIFQGYAIGTLNGVLDKMNGCPSEPDDSDHVIDCDAQLELRPLLQVLMTNVSGL